MRATPIPIALIALLAMGCTPPLSARMAEGRRREDLGAPSRTPAGTGWTRARTERGGFSIRMPRRPSVARGEGYAEDGARYEVTSLRLTTPLGLYAALAIEWEGGVVGDALESSRQLALRVFDSTEMARRSAERLRVPGYYAREDVGQMADGTYVALRQYVGRRRVYVVLAAVRGTEASVAVARTFVESMELEDDDAILPLGGDGAPVALYMPESDFAVTMPPLTMMRLEQVDVAERSAEVAIYESQRAGTLLRIRVVAFDRGRPDGAVDAVASAFDLGESAGFVSCSGFPGRRFTGRDGKTSLVFATAGRVYVLTALSSQTASFDGFFDSFRIL